MPADRDECKIIIVIVAACDLLYYSGFVHSYMRLCCEVSTALGQILLVSKDQADKRL